MRAGLLLLLTAAVTLPFQGCTRRVVVVEQSHPRTVAYQEWQESKMGPPPWAPAHGWRHKRTCQYYYDREVYYQSARRQWIWFESGAWRIGTTLPDAIRVNLGPSVTVQIEGNHPEYYHEKICAVYPPHHKATAKAGPHGKTRGRGKK